MAWQMIGSAVGSAGGLLKSIADMLPKEDITMSSNVMSDVGGGLRSSGMYSGSYANRVGNEALHYFKRPSNLAYSLEAVGDTMQTGGHGMIGKIIQDAQKKYGEVDRPLTEYSKGDYEGTEAVGEDLSVAGSYAKSGIHIKPSMKGTFTKWCKAHGYGGVNSSCIAAGKRAGGRIAKKAIFAQNAKGWSKKKKAQEGIMIDDNKIDIIMKKQKAGLQILDSKRIAGPSHTAGGKDIVLNGKEIEAEGGEYRISLSDGSKAVLNQEQMAMLKQGVSIEQILNTMPKARGGLKVIKKRAQHGVVSYGDEDLNFERYGASRPASNYLPGELLDKTGDNFMRAMDYYRGYRGGRMTPRAPMQMTAPLEPIAEPYTKSYFNQEEPFTQELYSAQPDTLDSTHFSSPGLTGGKDVIKTPKVDSSVWEDYSRGQKWGVGLSVLGAGMQLGRSLLDEQNIRNAPEPAKVSPIQFTPVRYRPLSPVNALGRSDRYIRHGLRSAREFGRPEMVRSIIGGGIRQAGEIQSKYDEMNLRGRMTTEQLNQRGYLSVERYNREIESGNIDRGISYDQWRTGVLAQSRDVQNKALLNILNLPGEYSTNKLKSKIYKYLSDTGNYQALASLLNTPPD